MSVSKVLAVVPVDDFDAAIAWYERFLGRPADARPMADLDDWHVTDSAWVSVFRNPDRRGSTLLNFAVDDLDTHIAELATQGITVGAVSTTTKNAKVATVADPDGNMIALIENPSN